jgi:hypothetical protein
MLATIRRDWRKQIEAAVVSVQRRRKAAGENTYIAALPDIPDRPPISGGGGGGPERGCAERHERGLPFGRIVDQQHGDGVPRLRLGPQLDGRAWGLRGVPLDQAVAAGVGDCRA